MLALKQDLALEILLYKARYCFSQNLARILLFLLQSKIKPRLKQDFEILL